MLIQKITQVRLFVVLSLVASLLFGITLSASAAQTKKLTVVKTFSRKDCSLAPWLIAQKKGFLEKEGIKLVFTGQLAPRYTN